ncbi:MAG TPA: NUDIX domain-containing protein, partial [Usitatibacter sp.]|nr:NUDIX domain-containing protein [Usitatibacter sp.]
EVSPLEPFEHAFTHFTLDVTPWRIRAARTRRATEARPATWLALAELDGAALPSPVRRLLRSVAPGG